MAMIVFLVLNFLSSLNDFSDGCNVGYYGDNCSKKCPNLCHDNECNVKTGKCLSCVKGHYSNNTNDCVSCPTHCTACSSNSFCFACKSGFRGEVCENRCTDCLPNTSCDKNTGYCFENCKDGRSGELCNIKCDSKCKSCNRHNNHLCISCADGENGIVCKEECLNQCLRSTCNKSHESCASECLSGNRADKTCNQTCLSYCKDRVCDISCKELVQPDRQSSSTSKANIGLIVGPVISAIAVICVGVIVYMLVKRRSTKRRQSDTNRTPATNGEENIELLSHQARTTTRMFPSEKKFTVLQMLGVLSAIKKKYVNMKLSVDKTEVTIEGDPRDIENAFKEIHNKWDEIEQLEYKHSKSRAWLEFLEIKQVDEYVKNKQKEKQMLGNWGITGTELTVFVHGKGNCEKFKNTLLDSVLEMSMTVDESSTYLLSSEWWGEFLRDIRKIFQEKATIFSKEQQELVIICTDDVVQQVTQLVKEFLDLDGITDAVHYEPDVYDFVSKFWTENDFDEIRKNGIMILTEANGIKLRGLLNNVTKGKKELNKKLARICNKPCILKRTGLFTVLEAAKKSGTINYIEQECRCVIKLPQENDDSQSLMLCDHEVIDSETLKENGNDSSTHASTICFQTRRHKIKIQLIQGDICQQKADVIVIGAASNIDVQSISALFSSLKQGGPQLKTDYNRRYPNGIQYGEVAAIDPGYLNCNKIYLTSLPQWKEARCNGGKELRNFMRESLRQADKYDKNTIAFSSSVTGIYLRYPVDMAVSIMYGAVVEFDSSYSNTSLKEINIIMREEDDETIKAFEDHQHKRIYGAFSVGSLSTDFVGGRIKIELVVGDLSAQKVDAILCSLLEDMNPNRSAICESVEQNGGISLRDECKRTCNNKLDFGKVVEISSGRLPCKIVLLAVLSKYTEENSAKQSLITTLQTALDLANSNEYKSLAIPAVETEYLSYPSTTAAKCMYDAVLDWVNNNQNASLQVVRIVMCSKDIEAQQIYRMCHLKTQRREIRNNRIFLGDGTIFNKLEEDSAYKMVRDGCAIGKIQLQVQVGNVLKNTADAIVIAVGANCGTKEQVLKKDGVMIMCNDGHKYIINVMFQDSLAGWRGKLVDCLEQADKNTIKSIAFPLLESGTEQNTFPADGIGECLFAAIDDFASQKPMSNVVDVRLVVDDSNAGCIPAICAALQARITALNFQWGTGKLFKSQPGFVAGSKQTNECLVIVHSDAKVNLDRCIKALEDRIGLAFTKKVVTEDINVIRRLRDEQIKNIEESDILADVTFDKQLETFTVVGPLRNVLAAVTCLHNKLRLYKIDENDRNSPNALYNRTKWHWLCQDQVASEKQVPYDIMSNYIIETAYMKGEQAVGLQFQDGKIYVIDFQKLVEYPKVNIHDTVMVIRKDVLRDDEISESKTSMVAKLETLNSGDEYNKVKGRFLEDILKGDVKDSQSVQVVKIESIENTTLYQQYKAKKEQMNKQSSRWKKKKKTIERELWHDTSVDNIPRIINNGFNRSFCGVYGDLYGQGVYFAADASYFVQSNLAKNKPGAKRYMFLANVLTRKLIKGTRSMRVLPPVKPDKPTILYDSAVDDVGNPNIFVIFQDAQAFPHYLITYTSK